MTRRAVIAALAGAFVPPRDPLTDPRPGDVVEKNGKRARVQSTIHDAGMDIVCAVKCGVGTVVWCGLATWREQCVGAAVIQRAEEA